MKINNKLKIAIIGLGYVGLPLAVNFGKSFYTIGFDINKKRISQLKQNYDTTNEISKSEIKKAKKLNFVNNINKLSICNIFIISVPTPIDRFKKPDLTSLINASREVSKVIKKDSVIIFESTVYPGVTEEVCGKIIEKYSKFKLNIDFFLGYSPERANPGDKKHTINNVVKITSGSNKIIANFIDSLYRKIKIKTHKVSSIKIAESAKVIENTQRDLNIAYMNELSIIFKKMNLDTKEIIDAASTKWNFNNYRPGLVGGHCIGIDPYYLTYISKKYNYNPKIILAGREINENISKIIYKEIKLYAKKKSITLRNSKILIMGITFKENCSDIRNSKVFDIINYFLKDRSVIEVFDPMVKKDQIHMYKKIKLIKKPKINFYNVILISVAHNVFKKISIKKIKSWCKKDSIIYDIKNIYKKKDVDLRL